MMKERDTVSTLAKELTMKNLIHYRRDSKTWQVVFTHPYIKGKRLKFKTPYKLEEKRFAKEYAEQVYSKIRVQHTHTNLFSDHSIADAIDEYSESKRLAKTDIGILRDIKKLIGKKDIKHITSQDYLTLVKHYRSVGNADSTIDRKFDILKAVLRFAVDNEWIERFPKIKKYDNAKWDEKGHRLSGAEKNKIILAMGKLGYTHLIDPFIFALLTGLRKSNIQNLKKSHLIQTTTGWELRFTAKEMKWKTRHSIALTRQMLSIINRNISDDSEYIFRGFNGNESLGDFKNSWNSVRAVAGVLNPNLNTYVRWHDLRHTCASDYAEQGINPYELMKLMHWQSLKMAERYVHNNAKTQRNVLEQFGTEIVPDLSQIKNGCNKEIDSYNVG